jgi:hypothetical protein
MLHDPSVWQFKLQCLIATCPAGETPLRADRWKVIRKVVKAGIRKRRAGLKRWHEIQHPENRYKRVALKLADWLQDEFPGRVNVVLNDAKYRAAQRALAVAALDDVVRQLKLDMLNLTTDLSVPRCSVNLLWRIGPYGERYKDDPVVPEARAVIWYDGTTSQWNAKLLAKLGEIGFPTAD